MFPSLDPTNNASYNEENPNYCSHYVATGLVEGKCQFDRSQVVTCPEGAQYTYAGFEMDSSVATDNTLVS